MPADDFSAHLACAAGCGGAHPIDSAIYACPTCSELLEVRHDLDALRRARTGTEWRELFDARSSATRAAAPSGVWSKKEWVAPSVLDANVVSLAEGATPLVRVDRYGRGIGLANVWIKQSGASPTGSFKDLGMTVLVSVVRQRIANGNPVNAVVCASTGDTSASLAAYCAAAGVRAAVLLPAGKITKAQLLQPLAHGALVCAIDTDFDGCMAIARRLAEEPGVYLANSMNCLRLEGQKTVALELVQQLGWDPPDWVVIPGGNLGNVAAFAAGFDMLLALDVVDKRPRICIAQAAAADPLYRAYRDGWHSFAPVTALPTEASAIRIGNPVSIRRAIRALKRYEGIVEAASESELAEAAARIDRTGFYACPQTGVALAALEKLALRGIIGPSDRAVVISTACGLKFTEFKARYHESAIAGVRSQRPNQPLPVANDLAAVRVAVLGDAT